MQLPRVQPFNHGALQKWVSSTSMKHKVILKNNINLTVNRLGLERGMKFVDDWIQTADLWLWKWPLNQLSHKNYPFQHIFCKNLRAFLNYLNRLKKTLFDYATILASFGAKLGRKISRNLRKEIESFERCLLWFIFSILSRSLISQIGGRLRTKFNLLGHWSDWHTHKGQLHWKGSKVKYEGYQSTSKLIRWFSEDT